MRKEDKKEFLFDAMSEIDEKIIDAAERYPLVVAKRRRFIRSAVSIAAAFAIIIAAIPVVFLLNGDFLGGNKSASDAGTAPEVNLNGNGNGNESGSGNVNGDGDGSESGSPTYPGSDIYDAPPGFKGEIAPSVTVLPSDTIDPEQKGTKENPFINTSKENAEINISTFSADVDTASYCRFRRLVTGGNYSYAEIKSIIGSSIRTEEWINYFDYSYNEAKEGSLFGVKSDIIKTPWNDSTYLFRTSLKACGSTEVSENNLVFLIDVSGSMSTQSKLPLLKKAFAYLVESLDENDTVSIVTYSGAESVVLEGCRGDKGELIMQAVNSLAASGSTNGEAGLEKAYTIAERYKKENGNNRIIMATDGDFNVGLSTTDAIMDYVSKKRELGIYISLLGFGSSVYGDGIMETIADNGNGAYYYIDGDEEAERIFTDKLTETLYTVADDLKLQVKFNPDAVKSYRLIGYENRMLATEDFDDDSKDAGDVGAEQCVTAVYEIELFNLPSETDEEYASLSIRYKPLGAPDSVIEEYNIGRESVREADDEMLFIASVIGASMLIRSSEYKGELNERALLEIINSIELSDRYMKDFRDYVNDLMTE
ncbi:MAG: von Willebrand factor type A domain-containing protein [Clostridia bacterium]|nr:von Willebrand factor type A domain-containing protein [Clostridia bacterium]